MPPRLPDDKRAQILEDIRAAKATGDSRNAIARRHDVSSSTVTSIATEHGLTDAFDRSATKNATAAAVADSASERARLARRFLDEAHSALDSMHAETVIYNFGGKDNTYNEKTVPEPPTGDKRNLMIIAATAADKHVVLDRHDSDTTGLAAVDSWLLFMSGKPAEADPA